jgi:lipopolysaccharide transport system permease protein
MALSTLSPSAAEARSGLWTHRNLIWQFTLRNVELRHKGSHLGLVWSFLSPLLLLGLYVFVFGYIFDGSFDRPGETRVEYALGIFLGLSLFHFLGETIGQSPGLITSNPNFVKKVVFPLQVLPAAAVGASLIHLGISLVLILAGIAFFGPGLTAGVLWLPVILLPLALFGLGIAWFVSALGVFLRDIAQITQFVGMALMFASAVFYPTSKIPEAAWQILRFNPLLLAVELSRDAVLWHEALNFRQLGYLYAAGLLCAWAGLAVFRKLKPAFADVL